MQFTKVEYECVTEKSGAMSTSVLNHLDVDRGSDCNHHVGGALVCSLHSFPPRKGRRRFASTERSDHLSPTLFPRAPLERPEKDRPGALVPRLHLCASGCYSRDSRPHLQTPGVVGFVGIGRRGIPIPDKQIEDIQTVLTQNIPCAIFPFLRVGQRVRIRGGCLDGIEGRLVTLKGDRSLVISVEPILRSIAIRLDGYDVEILSPMSICHVASRARPQLASVLHLRLRHCLFLAHSEIQSKSNRCFS